MTAPLSKQWEKTKTGLGKADVRTQFAALCYKIKNDKLRFLLITSRERGRWIVPKGWPILGQNPTEAVMTEAWEEAGVKGTVATRPVGLFSYMKSYGEKADLPCVAMVYAVEVEKLARNYPEKAERRRKWVSRKKAAAMVDDPELAKVIMGFDAATLA